MMFNVEGFVPTFNSLITQKYKTHRIHTAKKISVGAFKLFASGNCFIQAAHDFDQFPDLHTFVEEVIGAIAQATVLIDRVGAIGKNDYATIWGRFFYNRNEVDARPAGKMKIEYSDAGQAAVDQVYCFRIISGGKNSVRSCNFSQ